MPRLFFVLTIALLVPLATASQPAPLPSTTPWDAEALYQAPPFQWLESGAPVQSLTFQGLPYKEDVTQVFAYYATPTDFGHSAAHFPAMVLVHGGGGAAFAPWVTRWAKEGYVAIAMDLAGKGANRTPLAQGGPDQGHEQKFSTIDLPWNQQWSYHAVANVILAHSLIREFDEVDTKRIGLTGISWGGYLTCIVAGVDDRFRFAMPVYGCGFLRDNSVWTESEFGKMTSAQSDRWHQLWDPSRYLPSVRMPIVFLNGTNDFAYPMDSYARSCALVQSEKNYSIQLRMPHGHIFDFPEFFLVADHYLRNGTALPIVSSPKIKKGKIRASVSSQTKLVSARLHYTKGPHPDNKERAWVSRPMTIRGNRITGGAPPEDATAFYIDVRDERHALFSSTVIVR